MAQIHALLALLLLSFFMSAHHLYLLALEQSRLVNDFKLSIFNFDLDWICSYDLALIPLQSLLVTTFLPDNVLHVLQFLLLRLIGISSVVDKLCAFTIYLGDHLILMSHS